MSAADYLDLARQYFGPGIWFVLAVLVVELLNILTLRNLNTLGILPREASGLAGIPFAPLLHADFKHFLANFPPVVVLGFALGKLMPTEFWWIFAALTLGTGLLVWLFARKRMHIGASGVIYALFGFLTVHGYVSGNLVHVLVAAVLLLLYSGMLWGVIPKAAQTSWESHLAGLLVGALLAWRDIF